MEEFLFKKKAFNLDTFTALLVKKDTKSLIEEIGKLGVKGVSIETFLEALLKKLRMSLLAKIGVGTDEISGIDKNTLIGLIELLEEAVRGIAGSLIEELPLEIAIIRWCETGYGQPQIVHLEQNSPSGAAGTGHEGLHSATPAIHDTAQTIAPDVHSQSAAALEGEGVNDDIWKNILSLIKPVNASIEALLRAARPMKYDGKVLTLGVYYKFHKERLEDVHHRKILEDAVAAVFKSPTRVTCILVEPPPRKIVEEVKVEAVLTEGKDKDIMKAAEEIFGN